MRQGNWSVIEYRRSRTMNQTLAELFESKHRQSAASGESDWDDRRN